MRRDNVIPLTSWSIEPENISTRVSPTPVPSRNMLVKIVVKRMKRSCVLFRRQHVKEICFSTAVAPPLCGYLRDCLRSILLTFEHLIETTKLVDTENGGHLNKRSKNTVPSLVFERCAPTPFQGQCLRLGRSARYVHADFVTL